MRAIFFNAKREEEKRQKESFKDAVKRITKKIKDATRRTIAAMVIVGMLLPATVKAEERIEKETPKQEISYGFGYHGNDAGSAINGEVNFYDWLNARAGGTWLNTVPYGFGSINVTPQYNLFGRRFNLYYFGNVMFTHMASWFYTTNGVGASAHFNIGDFSFNLASLLQGGISYPTYDLLYAKWVNGFSVIYNEKIKLQMINTNYFAASKTPNTALAVDYQPRFNDLLVGVEYTDERLGNIGIATNISEIDPYTKLKYEREIFNKNGITASGQVAAGVRGYDLTGNEGFFPPNFFVGMGISLTFGGDKNRPSNYFNMEVENNNMLANPNFEKRNINAITEQEKNG